MIIIKFNLKFELSSNNNKNNINLFLIKINK